MNKKLFDQLIAIADDRPGREEDACFKYGYMKSVAQSLRSEIEFMYLSQFRRNWQFCAEDCDAQEVADKVAEEFSLAESTIYWAEHAGDNGEDDVGFGIRTFGGQLIASIGIVRVAGQWLVMLEGSEGDVRLNCIDDLAEKIEVN